MTAEEYFKEHLSGEPLHQDVVIEAMIDFAKYHVEQALKAAAENAYAKGEGSSLTTRNNNFFYTFAGHIGKIVMNKESILNAYPLKNIK